MTSSAIFIYRCLVLWTLLCLLGWTLVLTIKSASFIMKIFNNANNLRKMHEKNVKEISEVLEKE